MVTRKLIRITSPEAAALAAKKTSLSSSAAAEDLTTVNKQPTKLLTNGNKNETGGGKKRALPSKDALLSGEETKKRQKADKFVIDLADVPPQQPIPKSEGRQKEGSSKYVGVNYHKPSNKWQARITIEGKTRHIGCYEKEEEAANDFARALFKYKGQDALEKARGQKQSAPTMNIDLSNVPSIPPILKSAGGIKEGSSKYAGVCFNTAMNKWQAQIIIEGKQRHIGQYDKEEEAAANYARAVFKYKGQEALDKARERASARGLGVDLSDVPPQLPILKRVGNIKGGTSKYVGVNFDKVVKKWKAIISIDRKLRHIGYYENEEEAAIDYARAVFKFKGQDAVDKAREQNKQSAPAIDLSDVPSQQPILKSKEGIKEGSSKYLGVYFDKSMSKWKAVIRIDRMLRHVGWYKNEEEAAADYARALFKYKGQDALEKARGQKKSAPAIDLSNVPSISPILKSAGGIKEGSSKYAGVTLNKAMNKWEAQIIIEGKQYFIGYYEKEEVAATDYARALFKYKGHDALNEASKRKSSAPAIDLSDVPQQLPILKSEGNIKGGMSKYVGVSFDKVVKKWKVIISIGRKLRHIGYYENEEEAAVDYARAVFKFKGQEALDKARGLKKSAHAIDLSDVPPQPPIPKSIWRKEGASKYTGVTFNKKMNKWQAGIMIDGKQRTIGHYVNEEEAAVDYARAVFKYKGIGLPLGKKREAATGKEGERNSSLSASAIDLSGVLPQPPILLSEQYITMGPSIYAGVSYNTNNKWEASIMVDGKQQYIGYYENEEEAAIDYARAVLKYKGQEALDKAREVRKSSLTNGSDIKKGGGKKRALPPKDVVSGRDAKQRLEKADSFVFDLIGVPQQPPILKSKGRIKEGASKYTGVSFHKPTKKWMAKIVIEGKARHIGLYKNEEEAAIDYARAVFKYKPRGI